MQCSTHPNYKGTKYPGKRNQNCPDCQKLYKAVQDSQDRWNPYRSISTPNFKCDMVHLLAELSTIMLYGQQPNLFWRKDTPANNKAKEHFSKTYNQLKSWMQRSPATFTGFKTILYQIFVQHWMGFEGEKMRTEIQIDQMPVEQPSIPIESTTLDLNKKPSLRDFFEGENDG